MNIFYTRMTIIVLILLSLFFIFETNQTAWTFRIFEHFVFFYYLMFHQITRKALSLYVIVIPFDGDKYVNKT